VTGQRYGVVAHVHANLFALRTALEHLQAAGIDRLLSLGDVIGYGPHPVECVELLASFDPIAVAGNHEQIALGQLSDERCTEAARRSLAWTRTRLTDDVRAALAELPATAAAPGVLLAHGSPERIDEYVRSEARASELLDTMHAQHPATDVLLLGHTHQAWLFSRRRGTLLRERAGRIDLVPGELLLLNPGSVGQSRDRHAHARFLTLDLGQRTAQFHSVPYDARACRRALRDRGLPPEWCHIVPPPMERLRGVAGDVLRRAGLR